MGKTLKTLWQNLDGYCYWTGKTSFSNAGNLHLFNNLPGLNKTFFCKQPVCEEYHTFFSPLIITLSSDLMVGKNNVCYSSHTPCVP